VKTLGKFMKGKEDIFVQSFLLRDIRAYPCEIYIGDDDIYIHPFFITLLLEM
jgi:hypothetical protein